VANPFDDIYAAVIAAEELNRAADHTARKMAYILRGRLRQVDDTTTLRRLKQELAHFDARTGQWKDQK
jgi:hypothetical protein